MNQILKGIGEFFSAIITGKVSNQKYKRVVQIYDKYGIYFVFVLMVVILAILQPRFLGLTNILNIIRQISVVGLVALGVTLVIISGGIDLSSGSILACAAVISASLSQRMDWSHRFYENLPALPVIVPILAGLLIGVILGFINGGLIAKTRIPPFIATLGMMTAARGVALLYSNSRPISSLTPEFEYMGQGLLFGVVPIPILILILMAVLTYVLLQHTRFGKYIYAIGGNERAAHVSGIHVNKYKIYVYSYAGFLAGLAGVVLASRIGSGQPNLGITYELDAIASAVIGGTSLSGGIGTVQGTIVGALIIGVLKNGLDLLNVSSNWQQIAKGVIIVSAVIVDMARKKGTLKI